MSKEHRSASTKALLTQLQKDYGFDISEKSKRGAVKITPPGDVKGPIYHTHCTESALHFIKRDMKKLYGITLK